MKIVEITWIDSKGITSEWEFLNDSKSMPPCICHSIGYILEDKKDYITIVQSYDKESNKDHNQIMGKMTIPKCSIKKTRKIK